MMNLLLPAMLLLAAAAPALAADLPDCPAAQYTCLPGSVCKLNNGTSVCSCPSGFYGNGVTSPCIDINECLASPCPTGSKCVNMAGSYFCSCPTGTTMLLDANNQTCQVITSTISGAVISARNRNIKYSGVQVSLFTMVKEVRSTLIAQTTTDNQGMFSFDVAFGGRYMTCASPTGYEACVVHTVKALSTFLSSLEFSGSSVDILMDPNGGLTTSSTARRRRLTDINSLNIPVPSSLQNYEWEIHTIWTMDSPLYSCDWDSTVLSTINSGCHAGYKAANGGYCASTGRAVTIFTDSSCDYDTFGFEAVLISETGTRTYQHMVYGYGLNSSFANAANAQGQINVYRRGSSGFPVLAYSLSLSGAIRGNFKDRFWHTFSLAINTPASQLQGTGTFTEKNIVTCTPEQTTGSNTTLGFENGARSCS